MNNHYHLLLETPEGNLSKIMRHINGAYTTYYNIKRKRSGHFFKAATMECVKNVDATPLRSDSSEYLPAAAFYPYPPLKKKWGRKTGPQKS